MLAVDTNVIARYIIRDDEAQFQIARALIDHQDVFVPTTVLLETEWILRRPYRHTPMQIALLMRKFAGLPHVRVEAPGQLEQALAWLENGMDFADALHLAAAEGCDAFLTFDKDCVKIARKLGTIPVRAP